MPRVLLGLGLAVLASSTVVLRSGDIRLSVDPDSGAYEVAIGEKRWFRSGVAAFLGRNLTVADATEDKGTDALGSFSAVDISWADATGSRIWSAQFRAYLSPAKEENQEELPNFGRVVFRQTFLRNITRGYPSDSTGNRWWGESNGSGGRGRSVAQHDVDGDVDDDVDNDANLVYAGFPAFRLDRGEDDEELNMLTYGGIHMQNTALMRWGDNRFQARADTGYPLVLFSRNLTTAVLSPFSSFFVGIHSTGANGQLECGIKRTVMRIPGNFTYDTILVSGQGVNNTVSYYGETMMAKGGKTRVDPYEADFVLSHLGYWTDNGAYYYHYLPRPPFNNSEEALKAVKADALSRGIPLRYYQWDDWWFYNGGHWEYQAIPSVFPDGLTDWLQSPLSLYTGEYGANNPYRSRFEFVDHNAKTVLPVDIEFYRELFRNGTKAGMKMFEQDYLSSINLGTNLTSLDLNSGDRFFEAMNQAALEMNITLQLCMMHPCHALAASSLQAVTNARASPDHVRVYEHREEMIGWNSLLLSSLGVWSSRDNVWTNSSETRPSFNNETDVVTNTILAVLAGGPYGPGDAAGAMNRSLIMRTCRSDGVMLRADYPNVPLDKTFVDGFDAVKPLHVWATSSWIPYSSSTSSSLSSSSSSSSSLGSWSPLQYTYIIALNLDQPFSVSLTDVQRVSSAGAGDEPLSSSSAAASGGSFIAREVMANGTLFPLTLDRLHVLDRLNSVHLPACPTVDYLTAGSVFWTFAPVLANGWAFLGEVDKVVSASSRRVRWVRCGHQRHQREITSLHASAGAVAATLATATTRVCDDEDEDVVEVTLLGSPGETTTVAFAPPQVFERLHARLSEKNKNAAAKTSQNHAEMPPPQGDDATSPIFVRVSFPTGDAAHTTRDVFGNEDCTVVVRCGGRGGSLGNSGAKCVQSSQLGLHAYEIRSEE